MKRVVVCSLAAGLVALTGCVSPMCPVGSVAGSIYTDVSGPVAATGNTGGNKMGQATSTGILGFATGDSSIKAAAANGGITKISQRSWCLCDNHSHRLRRIATISKTGRRPIEPPRARPLGIRGALSCQGKGTTPGTLKGPAVVRSMHGSPLRRGGQRHRGLGFPKSESLTSSPLRSISPLRAN